MERLTTSQIADFINPLAFARKRTGRVGQSVVEERSAKTVRTKDIEASYRLVTGASARLETLAGNLQTMLKLAQEGQRVRGDQRKLQEVYGKLRSLSAGFDQVVDAIQFDDAPIFTGKALSLNLGRGNRALTLEARKLLTYGDNSLNLSQSEVNAKVNIDYKIEDIAVNQVYSVLGLDIESSSYIKGSNPALELEDGDYKVRTTYLGANSTIEILSDVGGLIEKKEGVDLSGSGREWVDFDVGVRLSFEKEQLQESVDKYDFETKGPAFLTASMSYERVSGHTLRTEESSITAEKAEFLFAPKITDSSGGTLKVANPTTAPVTQGKTALVTGSYNLDIDYRGENSTIKINDSLGRLKGFSFGVDLSAEGTTKVDLGIGFSFELNNSSFTENRQFTVAIKYERPKPAIEEFNFREYGRRVREAIEVVREERQAMQEAISEIEKFNQLRNSATTSGFSGSRTQGASGAISILSQRSFGAQIFNRSASAARIGLLANQIFSTTTALPTQANQSPESLASLQKAAAGGFVSLFT